MDLQAGAVELPLHRGRPADPCQGVGDAVGRLRQHRLDRPKHGEPEPGQAVAALGHRGPGHLPQVSREHGGPPDVRGAGARHPGHRVHHHPLQGPLADLAKHQPSEEGLLLGRGPPKEVVQDGPSPGLGSRTGRLPELLERPLHLEDGEGGDRGGRREVPERGPSHADRPPGDVAREVRHGDRHLVRRSMAQGLGQPGHLLQPLRGRGHPGRRPRDVLQQHGQILPRLAHTGRRTVQLPIRRGSPGRRRARAPEPVGEGGDSLGLGLPPAQAENPVALRARGRVSRPGAGPRGACCGRRGRPPCRTPRGWGS